MLITIKNLKKRVRWFLSDRFLLKKNDLKKSLKNQ